MLPVSTARSQLHLQFASGGSSQSHANIGSSKTWPTITSSGGRSVSKHEDEDLLFKRLSSKSLQSETCIPTVQGFSHRPVTGQTHSHYDLAGTPEERPCSQGPDTARSSASPSIIRVRKRAWGFPSRPDLSRTTTEKDKLTPITQHQSPPCVNRPLPTDFVGNHPWTGEDLKSELLKDHVRNGFPALPHVKTEKEESNSAKHTLAPYLTQANSLRGLGSFFDSVLRGREERCRNSSQPVHKVPPRVTLTEQKRESWLADLANPLIPLRKQNRPIPHALRGKVLLEQCLARRMPLARASWLAKCVGLHELRTSRRKEACSSAVTEREIKWILEWTMLVEEFVDEKVGSSLERADWKQDVTYALHLSTRLLGDGLLDTEHYLQWVLERFENSSLERLPLWLLAVEKDQVALTSNYRTGQRLAVASATTCYILLKQPDGSSQPLYHRLQRLIADRISSKSNCFMFPSEWQAVRRIFQRILELSSGPSSEDVSLIIRANDYLYRSAFETTDTDNSKALSVVTFLDTFSSKRSLEDLSASCLAIMANLGELVVLVISWATSLHRMGRDKEYLACRLIKHWTGSTFLDVRSTIFEALETLRTASCMSSVSVGRLYADLSRSGHFGNAEYLQHLVATGGLARGIDHATDLEVLSHMPTTSLPPGLLNLRAMLLRGKRDIPTGSAHLVQIKQNLAARLKAALTQVMGSIHQQEFENSLQTVAPSDVFELSKWMKSSLVPFLAKRPGSPDAYLTLPFVELVVIMLEQLDDYPNLIDILTMLTTRCDQDALLPISLSLEINAELFNALGQRNKLWQALFNRYRSSRSTNGPHKSLCQFLTRTSPWISHGPSLDEYLRRELDFCDTGIAACTPLSEVQVDTGDDNRSDLDRILANGPNLNSNQLAEALEMMLSHLCRSKVGIDVNADAVANNLVAIRNANEESFNPLLKSIFQTKLADLDSRAVASVVSVLVSSECVSIADLVGYADCASSTRVASESSLALLHFFFAPDDTGLNAYKSIGTDADNDANASSAPQKKWQRRLWAKQLIRDHCPSVLDLIENCLKLSKASPRHAGLKSLFKASSFTSAIQQLLLTDSSRLAMVLERALASKSGANSGNVQDFVLSMVDPSGTNGSLIGTSKQALVVHLFSTLSATSMTCYETAMCFAMHVSDDSANDVDSLAQTCIEQAHYATSRNCALWTRLVSRAGTLVTRRIRDMSEKALLFCPTSGAPFHEAFATDWIHTPRTYAELIRATRLSIPVGGDAETGRLIVRHLNLTVKMLGQYSLSTQPAFPGWLRAIASTILAHHASFTSSTDLTPMLYALCRLLQNNEIQQQHDVIETLITTVSFFVPKATAETMSLLRAHLYPSIHDTKLRYLLGLPSPTAQRFQLTPEPRSGPPIHLSDPSYHRGAPSSCTKFDMLAEAGASPINYDASLSVRLFDACKLDHSG